MRRTKLVAMTCYLLVTSGAGASTASASQPEAPPVVASPAEQRVQDDVPLLEVRRVDREPRRRGSMPYVIPRGPEPVPLPELHRSGPELVPIPRLRSGEPLDSLPGHREVGPQGSRVIPEELEDAVETLVP